MRANVAAVVRLFRRLSPWLGLRQRRREKRASLLGNRIARPSFIWYMMKGRFVGAQVPRTPGLP